MSVLNRYRLEVIDHGSSGSEMDLEVLRKPAMRKTKMQLGIPKL